MLAIILFRNAGDKIYQFENPEMLATVDSNYNFQKFWRYMLAIRMFRNTVDNNYNYNFWRAPQQL